MLILQQLKILREIEIWSEETSWMIYILETVVLYINNILAKINYVIKGLSNTEILRLNTQKKSNT